MRNSDIFDLRLSGVFYLLAIVIALLAGVQVLATPRATPAMPQVYQDAIRLDPLGNRKLRPPVAGAYRSPFGVQIHPYCFEIARKNSKLPATRAEMEQNIERWIQKTVGSLVEGPKSCYSRYEVVRPYAREWIQKMRRTVLTCTDQASTKANYSGLNVGISIGAQVLLEAPARKGIDLSTWLTPLARRDVPLIILPENVFRRVAVKHPLIADYFSHSDINVLVHEGFHSTHANNRSDHNDLGVRTYADFVLENEVKCEEDILDDRVYFFSALCNPGGERELLVDRIRTRAARCGIERACRAPLERELNRDLMELIAGYYMPSEAAPAESAKASCGAIVKEGYCRHRARTQKKTFLRFHPELVAVAEQVQARVEPYLPRTTNDVPVALLELFPEISERILSQRGSRCFQAAFSEGPDGTLYVRGEITKRWVSSIGARFWEAETLSDRLGYAIGAMARSTTCREKFPGDYEILLRAIVDFSFEASGVFKSPFMQHLVRERFVHGVEDYVSYAPFGYEFRPTSDAVSRMIGPKLLESYLDAIRRLDPTSRSFDCSDPRL